MKSDIYFKHDLYAVENDECLRLVCSDFPVWGEAVFFRALSILYRNSGEPCLQRLLVNDVAHDLYTDNKDKIEDIINELIEVGIFKKSEDGKVFSARVQRECEKQRSFSEKQRKNVEKRWNSHQSDTSGIPVEYQTDTSGNTYKQEQEQEQDNKEKRNITNVIFPKKKDENEDSDSDSVSEESEFALLNEEEEKVETVKDNTPYKEIADYWNQGASKAGYPQIVKLTNGRKAQIKCRWDEFGRDVFKAMDNVFKSDFLRKWGKCTIDWMMTPSKMLRAIEGMYRNDDEEKESDSSKQKMYRDYSDITDEDLEKKFSWEK